MDATSENAATRTFDARWALILVLFLTSGATGLIDQLCFSKYLTYIVGSTAYAVSAVLAAFMTGLALGAHAAGKFGARARRPLAAYGVLELLVGVAVALSPLAFKVLTPLYVSLARAGAGSVAFVSALRWLSAMLVVIVPTTAMGATLPLLTRVVAETSSGQAPGRARELRLTALYAMNTLGGALGALLSAYVILPALGIAHTLFASAGASALIGVLALVASRREAAGALEPAHAKAQAGAFSDSVERPRALLVLAFISGALVFACEVVFTHLLALIIGNSAYAFGVILTAFLSSLFLGAAQVPRAQRRFGADALPIGLALTAALLTVTLPLWDKLPFIFLGFGKLIQSFGGREAIRALVAFAILLVPTTCMGLTFPLLLQRVVGARNAGQWVGRLTATNTLGAVFGSLFTGYVMLPGLGSQRSLLAVALAFGASAWLLPMQPHRRRTSGVLCGATVLLAVLLPRWDAARLTSGSNVYFDADQTPAAVLMMREDVHGGVTTVAKRDDVYTLYTNGKFQGNTGWEMRAQRLFAHYPSLFVDHFGEALVIGLGTGTTLGTLTAYPWQRLNVVEISPSIVAAAHRYFGVPNRGALDDPRVRITHDDGRNHLLVSEQRYDLISMELSSVWFAGAANLYNREYYALVREHLAPRGVFQQWVQLHHIRRRDFATILHTLRLEFPHVLLFYGGGQGIIVASRAPLHTSEQRLAELGLRAGVRETVPEGRTLPELLDDVLLETAGLDRFLNESARVSGEPLAALVANDDNLYLEYATPRGNTLPWSAREALVSDIRRFRDDAAIAALLGP